MGHPQPVNETGLAFGYNGAPSSLEQAVNYAFIQLGAGAVRATVDDFIALDAALSAGKIVSRWSLEDMMRIPADRPESGVKFGLGVFVGEVSGVKMHGHTGGTNGYISDFKCYTDDDAMLIALANPGFVKTRWLREAMAKDALRGALTDRGDCDVAPALVPRRSAHAPIGDIEQPRPQQQDERHTGAARRAFACGLGRGVEFGPERRRDQAAHEDQPERDDD